jgi:hypothetical protein
MNDAPFPTAGTWFVMVEGPSIHFTIGAAGCNIDAVVH